MEEEKIRISTKEYSALYSIAWLVGTEISISPTLAKAYEDYRKIHNECETLMPLAPRKEAEHEQITTYRDTQATETA